MPKPRSRAMTASPEEREAAPPMRFVDFAIRAWREANYLQVLAHSTPAGGMRQPVPVKVLAFNPDDYRIPNDATTRSASTVGRELARLLLPTAVWNLLGESLRIIAPNAQLGLRIRLCLDEELIDLPWELLYRPDVEELGARSGFLLMDGRISLVREPPSVLSRAAASNRTQRGLFVGTMFDDGSDGWSVGVEYDSLVKALAPITDLIALDFASADGGDEIAKRIAAGCDVFHYSGHTESADGYGTMVQLAHWADQSISEATSARAPWSATNTLAPLLASAGVRLAVFNACNSGFWNFVRPLIRSGVPTVIGVQGIVSNIAALHFAERLYQSLAVGLSLDEAMTSARLHVMDPGRSMYECEWARFMAYMPTDDPVVFPRPADSKIQKHQRQLRDAREQSIRHASELARDLDGAAVSRMLSEIAERSVLILGRFTDQRKAILDAIRVHLGKQPTKYVPILFDFDKPRDRDLIESIVRFAALSRFVIADLSDPKSIPSELQAIVPQFPSLPIVPIIEATQRPYATFDNLARRDSVLPTVSYASEKELLKIFDTQVLAPAEQLYARLNPAAA